MRSNGTPWRRDASSIVNRTRLYTIANTHSSFKMPSTCLQCITSIPIVVFKCRNVSSNCHRRQ